MLGMGCPGMTVSTTRSFTAHVSLQCVYNLTRRKRLVNACRLPPASVCNRHQGDGENVKNTMDMKMKHFTACQRAQVMVVQMIR